MSNFDDRRDGFEKKHALDQELIFKAEARGCKLFGLWMAEKLGKTGDAADAYAREVIASNLKEVGFGDVIEKVMIDVHNHNLDISAHILEKKIEEFFEIAKEQIASEA
jgi:hypothetical protein